MRIAIFTANAVRHKYVANELSKKTDDAIIISECRKNDAIVSGDSFIEKHFYDRYLTESRYFSGNDYFFCKTLPIIYGEVNLPAVFNIVKSFKPQLMLCYGASIIKEPLLSLLPPGHFINLHLGLSPYYRGNGTNFWPFVNDELECVGSTILHIDAGIDTGDIVTHVTPVIEKGDNVHTVGCKVIKESAMAMVKLMDMVKAGKALNRVKQWHLTNGKYYKKSDFTEEMFNKYNANIASGIVERYVRHAGEKRLRLITIGKEDIA